MCTIVYLDSKLIIDTTKWTQLIFDVCPVQCSEYLLRPDLITPSLKDMEKFTSVDNITDGTGNGLLSIFFQRITDFLTDQAQNLAFY